MLPTTSRGVDYPRTLLGISLASTSLQCQTQNFSRTGGYVITFKNWGDIKNFSIFEKKIMTKKSFKLTVEHWDTKITIEKDYSDVTMEELHEMWLSMVKSIVYIKDTIKKY